MNNRDHVKSSDLTVIKTALLVVGGVENLNAAY